MIFSTKEKKIKLLFEDIGTVMYYLKWLWVPWVVPTYEWYNICLLSMLHRRRSVSNIPPTSLNTSSTEVDDSLFCIQDHKTTVVILTMIYLLII